MNRSQRLTAILAMFLGILVLASPQAAVQGFTQGVQLCITRVLPALFPFFVICDLVMSCPDAAVFALPLRFPARRLGFQSPAAPLALLLCWLGGYVVCAQLVRRLRPRMDEREAQLLLLLGCCSGPGFVVGYVGGLLLGSPKLGFLLYGLQLAANLLAAALTCPMLPASRGGYGAPIEPPEPLALPQAITRGVDSSLNVCGCVIFFRMVGRILDGILPAGPLLSGLLEVSAGCADFAALGGRAALYGCCFCLSILGVSVWAQLTLFLENCLPLGPLLLCRFWHAILFPLITALCLRWLPGTAAVYSTLAKRVVVTHRLSPDAALIGAIFLCAALYKARKTLYNNS